VRIAVCVAAGGIGKNQLMEDLEGSAAAVSEHTGVKRLHKSLSPRNMQRESCLTFTLTLFPGFDCEIA